MKGHVDKSMGIVTLIEETLDKIKPTEQLAGEIFVGRNESAQIPQVILRPKH